MYLPRGPTGCRNIPWLLRLVAVGLVCCWCGGSAAGLTLQELRQANAADFISSVQPEQLKDQVSRFAALGSRIPGYPGHSAAADMVEAALGRLGFSYVHRETFELASPVDLGARLECAGLDSPVRVHPLWPNLVRLVSTLPEGITGELIYVGRGELKDLNGFELTRQPDGDGALERAVVLMDFNTKRNFLKIRSLGAGAIIFIEPDQALRYHAASKILEVPLNIPRCWASRAEAEKLLAIAGRRVNPDDPYDLTVTRGPTVTVHSKMEWRRVWGRNFSARLDGLVPPLSDQGGEWDQDWEDLGRELIVLVGYYDSMSVVPSLAPGAEQSCNIVGLLKIAELLAEQRQRIEAVCQAADGLREHLSAILAVGARLRKSMQLKRWDAAAAQCRKITDGAEAAGAMCHALAATGPEQLRAEASGLAEVLDCSLGALQKLRVVLEGDDADAEPAGGEQLVEQLDEALAAVGRKVQARPVLFVAADANGFDHAGMNHWMAKHLTERLYENQLYVPGVVHLSLPKAIGLLDESIGALDQLASSGADCSKGYVFGKGSGRGGGRGKGAITRILQRLHGKLVSDGPEATAAAGLDVLQAVRGELRKLADAGLPIDANGDCPGYWLFDPDMYRRGRSYDFKLMIGLELSSHSRTVASLYSGTRGATLFIKHRRLLGGYAELLDDYQRRFHGVIGGDRAEVEDAYHVNGVTPVKGQSFESLIPMNLSLFTTAVVNINQPGLTLASAFDLRETLDTPSDRPDRMDFANFAHQLREVSLLMREVAGDPSFVSRGYTVSMFREYKHGFMAHAMEKKIGESVIADFPVSGVLAVLSRYPTWAGVRRWRMGITNDDGNYWDPFISGVEVDRDAYILDKHGNIIGAADRGNEGHGTYPLKDRQRTGNIVMFRCRSLDIYDTLDPMLIKYLGRVDIYDEHDAPPPLWGYNTVPSQDMEVPPGHVVFFEPKQRVKVCVRRGFWSFQYLLLNTEEDGRENPLGFGLDVGEDRRAAVFRCAERVAADMERLNRHRFGTLNKFGITSGLIDSLVERGSEQYQRGEEFFKQRRYDRYMEAIRRARGYGTAAYPLIKDLEKDTVQGIVLYFALLIPFAFFCERLLFGFPDIKKQILTIGAIFVGVFFIMRLVHPAFKVSQSPYVIFLAFIILALAVIVLILVIGKFNEQMAEMKRAASRIHHTDVGRLSATYAAVMLGISNMRKRRLRTFLTTVTLVLITYAVLSFTSLTSYTHFFELPIEASPSYEGALIRHRTWDYLSPEWIEYVEAGLEPDSAVVAPRSWFYVKDRNALSQPVRHDNSVQAEPSAVVSISQAQAGEEGSNFEALLMTVGGATVFWPRDDRTDVCIVTEQLAETLDLAKEDVGAVTLRIGGTDLLLSGILRWSGLTGSELLPADDQAVRPPVAGAVFVNSKVLDQLGGEAVEVRIVPHQAGKAAGFLEPVAGSALLSGSLPELVKLGRANAVGFVGMTAAEPKVSGIDSLLRVGRWLGSDYGNECVLPDSLARQLNVRDQDVASGRAVIQTLGSSWKVVGLFDTDLLQTFFDLDGGHISPLEPQWQKMGASAVTGKTAREEEAKVRSSSELKDFKHLDPGRVIFVPFERLNEMGGRIMCIAIGFDDFDKGRDQMHAFLERSNALVFLAKGGETKAMTSMGRTGVSGLADLLVPILIGAFIIVNTMMGSVYERHREIGIYSSVGLAPVHISALFIAESFVYAVMGAILGYLLGQIGAKIIVAYGITGIELNYSSAATMLATLLVMGIVLLSAIYPSRVASQMAVPDVTRRWVLTEPSGDEWYFKFPFTVATPQVLSLFVFLNDWFDGYREESVGVFYTTELDFHAESVEHGQSYVISLTMWLSPFDRGVSQSVKLRTMPTEDEGVSQIEVEIKRLAGEHSTWYRLNRRFLREVRKQFLIFRTVPPAVREQYGVEGTKTLGLDVVPA